MVRPWLFTLAEIRMGFGPRVRMGLFGGSGGCDFGGSDGCHGGGGGGALSGLGHSRSDRVRKTYISELSARSKQRRRTRAC